MHNFIWEYKAFCCYPQKWTSFYKLAASIFFLVPRICGSVRFTLGVTGQMGSECGVAWFYAYLHD